MLEDTLVHVWSCAQRNTIARDSDRALLGELCDRLKAVEERLVELTTDLADWPITSPGDHPVRALAEALADVRDAIGLGGGDRE